MNASSIASGQCVGQPDACLTPQGPVMAPMVYVNMGMLAQAVLPATKVLLMKMPAVVQGSMIPTTNGNQPGVGGGVASGTIMGPARFTKASTKVLFQGQGAVYVTATTMQNMTNTTGAQVAPSQAKVIVAP